MDLEQLAEDLQNPDRDVRMYALKGLGELGTEAEEAIPVLVNILNTAQDLELRWRIVTALGVIALSTDKAFPAVIAALGQQSRMVFSTALLVLGKLGDRTIPFLVNALKNDPNVFIRSGAAGALARIKTPGVETAVPALIFALDDPEMSVRSSAAFALGNLNIETDEAIEGLILKLDDPEWRVRDFAAQALGKVGALRPEIIHGILKLLDDDEDMVRYTAITTLEELKPKTADVEKKLLELADDEDFVIRVSIADLIGVLGISSPKARSVLEHLLKDEIEDVRDAAQKAFNKISKI